MAKTNMLRAVVLAAGASSRMGAPKAGLPLTASGDTFLSRLVRSLVAAGLPEIVIVTGAAPEAVHRAAGRIRPPVRFAHNAGWQGGQLTSLLVGLGDDHGVRLEGLLLALVDAPLVSVKTIQHVVQAWRQTRAPIVRPVHGEQHGHPVVFDRAVFDALRAADPAVGAKAVVRAHADALLNVPVEDAGAFLDIDTPEEYHALRRQQREAGSPQLTAGS